MITSACWISIKVGIVVLGIVGVNILVGIVGVDIIVRIVGVDIKVGTPVVRTDWKMKKELELLKSGLLESALMPPLLFFVMINSAVSNRARSQG